MNKKNDNNINTKKEKIFYSVISVGFIAVCLKIIAYSAKNIATEQKLYAVPLVMSAVCVGLILGELVTLHSKSYEHQKR